MKTKNMASVKGWLKTAITFAILLAGCQQSPEGGKKIVLDLEQDGMNETEFLELITDLQLIPLETSDSALIHFYDKLYINEQGIYVLDNIEKTLFIFNPDGSFRSKLCRVGRAPGEYMDLDDFKVDENGHLFLYEGGIGNLHEYDAQGNFVQKTTLVCGEEFDRTENGYVVYSGNCEDYTLYTLDKEGNVLQQYLSTENTLPFHFHPNGGMVQSGERLLFAPMFDYTIYEVSGDTCIPRYTFDFLADNLPADILHDVPDKVEKQGFINFIQKMTKFHGVVSLSKFYAHGKWLGFLAKENILINTETHEVHVLNDLGGPLFALSGNPWFVNEKGEIYTHVTASNVIHGILPVIDDYIDDYPFLKPLKKRKIQETDNDWIFKAKLKE